VKEVASKRCCGDRFPAGKSIVEELSRPGTADDRWCSMRRVPGMERFKPAIGPSLVLIAAMVMVAVTAVTDATSAGRGGRRSRSAVLKLTLPQAVSTALTRNLRIADARLAVQEKEHQRRSAFSDFFPSLDVQYVASGYRYRQLGTVSGFSIAHDSRRARAHPYDYPYRIDPYRTFSMIGTITQPVYSGGRLLNNYKFARLGVDYSQIQLDVERQDLILEVYEAYYQMMQAEKLLGVANESIRALEALRNQTVEFFKAGVVPKVDVLSTEGQLAAAKIQRTQALADRETFRSSLNFLLRYPQETRLEIVQDYEYRPSRYRIPAIYSIAANNRLEIRQANISVEQAMALVRSSQADLIPSVTLQVQGSRTNDDWNPFDHEAINDWQIQGILSWAFDMFRSRETVKERKATEARAFVSRELLVEQIMNQVKDAFISMRRSEQDIFNNRKAVEFRRENFRINQERYKEQVATYVEVLDAQRQLAQSEGDYYISLIGYRINRALLERRMGILR
jgi:outer membrane protein